MESEVTAGEVRLAQFRTAIRGLDRVQVEAFLEQVAARIEELEAERQRLKAQLGDSEARDLESEFDAVGQEVSGILQAAREAADAMRERASLDASRWRSEAMAEAEGNRREAVADAEALRRDAWATGTEVLEQAEVESRKLREESERDVLTVMGEAEREAHRLTSGARREADDLVRNATMDSEKLTSEATKRRDAIIEAASKQAAAAQERTRALEQRRDELLEELEKVRSTLTRLEGSLEEKRESLDLSSAGSTSVRVIPSRAGEDETWEPGETVRVVRTDEPPAPRPEPVVEDKAPVEAPSAPAPDEDTEGTGATSPPAAAHEDGTKAVERPVDVPEARRNDVSALFASLRSGGHVEAAEPAVEPVSKPTEETTPAPAPATDWIEERDARLLPITNRALRGAKKSITELQNIALDALRTEESWRPDHDEIAETLQAELIAVWAESFAAGHAVSEEMTGSRLKRPPTPQSAAAEEFAAALGEAVSNALDESGTGQRERQSAASRVFRVWRTDVAERRIRELAIHGYEQGIEMSVSADASVV